MKSHLWTTFCLTYGLLFIDFPLMDYNLVHEWDLGAKVVHKWDFGAKVVHKWDFLHERMYPGIVWTKKYLLSICVML